MIKSGIPGYSSHRIPATPVVYWGEPPQSFTPVQAIASGECVVVCKDLWYNVIVGMWVSQGP